MSSRSRPTGGLGGLALIVAVSVLAALVELFGAGAGTALAATGVRAESAPQTAWAACNTNDHSTATSTFVPMLDSAAAALVTPEPETRPDNDKPFAVLGVDYPAPNTYVPTNAQLAAFRAAKTSLGEPVLQLNPYLAYVDGRDGMSDPSTDDLIQWAAHKWGIPENWLRAEYVLESYWNMYTEGDLTSVTPAQYNLYPRQSRVRGQFEVYQSLGITQVRWAPDGSLGAGSDPLRWESEAFNIDFQAATVRFFYDNPSDARAAWGDSSYVPCQQWNSIGGWYSPYPWNNSGQAQYIAKVQADLSDTAWESSAFVNWTPPYLPVDLTLL